MKFKVFLLFLMACHISSKAQFKKPSFIATPNTAAIAQYGVIPMSLYTGKANISIPIFDTNVRGINLDASLLYDTSGMLVNSLPSWTGHSWTLNVGGVITRSVKGYQDEYDKENHYAELGPNWENYFHRYESNVRDSKEGFGDYMPDIFYFNFMGHSGKFFLGNDGEWKVESDENLMVEFNINDQSNYITPFIEYLPSPSYGTTRGVDSNENSTPRAPNNNRNSSSNSNRNNGDDSRHQKPIEAIAMVKQDEEKNNETDRLSTFTDGNQNASGNNGSSFHPIPIKKLTPIDQDANQPIENNNPSGTSGGSTNSPSDNKDSGTYRQPKSIKGFTITDQEGNRYVFGGEQKLNASEYSINLLNDNNGNADAEMYANSWYLTAVYDRFGVEVYNFEYERGLYIISTSMCCSVNSQETMPLMMINSPVYLSKVTASDGTKIEFVKDSRILTSIDFYSKFYHKFANNINDLYKELVSLQRGQSISHCFIYLTDNKYAKYQNPYNTDKKNDPLRCMGMSPLKEIIISKQNQINKKYVLQYNTDTSTRLHLLGVEVKDNNNQPNGLYKFKYNNYEGLPTVDGHPDYLTTQSDYWGYYNGNSNNKDVNSACTMYGMLTEIKYPTGGVTNIEYEINRYSKYRNVYHDGMELVIDDDDAHGAENKLAGGLRVRKICNYEDSLKRKQLSQSDFSYFEGGQLSTNPYFLKATLLSSPTGYFSPFVLTPISNVFGYHIGYSKVMEELLINGEQIQKLYEYSNFSDYKEESCWKAELDEFKNNQKICSTANATLAAYDEWTERDYMRGRLLSITNRNYDDSKWSVTRFKYRQDKNEMENNYVTGYVDQSKASHPVLDTDLGPASYKLFYPKYDIVEQITETGYGYNNYITDFACDTTVYNKKDYTISINGDYAHKADMRLCSSEINHRNCYSDEKEYNYMFDNYYTPVTSIKEYRNEKFVKEYRTEYAIFNQNNSKAYSLPKYMIERYFDNSDDTIYTYKDYTNRYLPSEYVNEEGQNVKQQWDQYDKLTSYTIGDFTTSCIYNNGLITKMIMPNKFELNYEYDNMQRLSSIKNMYGNFIKKFKYFYRTEMTK